MTILYKKIEYGVIMQNRLVKAAMPDIVTPSCYYDYIFLNGNSNGSLFQILL